MKRFNIIVISLISGLVIGIVFAATNTSIVYGTVTSDKTYTGIGSISGFASGSTGANLQYHKITILYKDKIFNATIGCDFYPIGSQFPLFRNAIGIVKFDTWSIQIGCRVE